MPISSSRTITSKTYIKPRISALCILVSVIPNSNTPCRRLSKPPGTPCQPRATVHPCLSVDGFLHLQAAAAGCKKTFGLQGQPARPDVRRWPPLHGLQYPADEYRQCPDTCLSVLRPANVPGACH